jgi:uncharacterized membrane protein YkoI
VSASFGSQDGTSVYEVNVAMNDGTFTSLEIDAQTGKVVQNRADVEQGEMEQDGTDAD